MYLNSYNQCYSKFQGGMELCPQKIYVQFIFHEGYSLTSDISSHHDIISFDKSRSLQGSLVWPHSFPSSIPITFSFPHPPCTWDSSCVNKLAIFCFFPPCTSLKPFHISEVELLNLVHRTQKAQLILNLAAQWIHF